MKHFGALAVAPLLLFVSACSSDDDSGENSAPKLDGVVHSTVFDEDTKVVPGVEICVVGRKDIPCVTTDDLGIGDLAVPKNAELVLSYEKAEFVTKHRLLLADESLETGLGTWLFQRKVWYEALANDLEGAIDFNLGMLGLQTLAIDGVTFDVDPQPPKVAVQFRLCPTGPGLCACVSGDTCELGLGGFFDLPPGKYQATFTAPGKTCTPKAFACTDGTPGCMALDVVAGVLSFGHMPCE